MRRFGFAILAVLITMLFLGSFASAAELPLISGNSCKSLAKKASIMQQTLIDAQAKFERDQKFYTMPDHEELKELAEYAGILPKAPVVDEKTKTFIAHATDVCDAKTAREKQEGVQELKAMRKAYGHLCPAKQADQPAFKDFCKSIEERGSATFVMPAPATVVNTKSTETLARQIIRNPPLVSVPAVLKTYSICHKSPGTGSEVCNTELTATPEEINEEIAALQKEFPRDGYLFREKK